MSPHLVGESPELATTATSRRDLAELVTADQTPRPPSCSPRRDEAVAADHAAIGAWTKPHAPAEVPHCSAREEHGLRETPEPRRVTTMRRHRQPPFAGAAVPDCRPSAAGKPSPPPGSPRRRRSTAVSPPSPVIAGKPPPPWVPPVRLGLVNPRVDFFVEFDQTRFKPFEGRSDPIFRHETSVLATPDCGDLRGHMTSVLATPDCGDLRGYKDVCTYDALEICGYGVDYRTSDACRVIYVYPYEENAGCRESYLCTIIAFDCRCLVH
ncbi:hypothetical protein N665_1297s0001 [Sinapis alba]|nr:hypothetical protein N665_1297s0001 [Sinapis alba]